MSESTLTAWFKYIAHNPDDEIAKETLYVNFSERYTFHLEGHPRYWAPRKEGFSGTVGRMYTVSQRNINYYHLRLLLLHVPGATSFMFFRTFEGHLHSSYQAAARARGLLADDTEWSAAMTEAALFQTPIYSDPYLLWVDHREHMAGDYLYRYQKNPANANNPLFAISDEMYGHCLLDLNDILADHRYDLQTMEGFKEIFPSVDTRANRPSNHSNTFERMHNKTLF
ncbi:hypothetical protein BD408DRAFT_428429 [Parasitella parasitica]|nr:hypothetical protein BD408DRAFT_428429 [Parasitella parasitica]